VFVGSSTGAVSVFEVSKENTRFLSTCSSIHKDSVMCITSTSVDVSHEDATKSSYFMSSDENGGIVFWSFDSKTNACIIRRMVHIEEDYCTCARSFDHLIIGGFGSGRVLVWLVDGSMTDTAGPHEDGPVVDFAEIAAHARSINAMDVCKTNGLLATAAEDSVVCVFQLPKSESGDVVFMTTRVLDNFGLLSGIAFAHSELLAVAAYDQKRLWMLSCDSQ
jgi:WD40 repeat protein